MNRNLCMRGCLRRLFQLQQRTLPWAKRTGNLTVRRTRWFTPLSMTKQLQRATGVRVIDGETKQELVFKAATIFVNASALKTPI